MSAVNFATLACFPFLRLFPFHNKLCAFFLLFSLLFQPVSALTLSAGRQEEYLVGKKPNSELDIQKKTKVLL